MIKVIEGHKVKPNTNIQDIFLELRANAMQYPGYIGAENLIGEQDPSIVVFVSTWNAAENWRAWEVSSVGAGLYQRTKDLLVEESKVSIYRIVSTHWWYNFLFFSFSFPGVWSLSWLGHHGGGAFLRSSPG